MAGEFKITVVVLDSTVTIETTADQGGDEITVLYDGAEVQPLRRNHADALNSTTIWTTDRPLADIAIEKSTVTYLINGEDITPPATAPGASPNTYWTSPDVADGSGAAGTEGDPCSFPDVLTKLVDYDTVRIKQGTQAYKCGELTTNSGLFGIQYLAADGESPVFSGSYLADPAKWVNLGPSVGGVTIWQYPVGDLPSPKPFSICVEVDGDGVAYTLPRVPSVAQLNVTPDTEYGYGWTLDVSGNLVVILKDEGGGAPDIPTVNVWLPGPWNKLLSVFGNEGATVFDGLTVEKYARMDNTAQWYSKPRGIYVETQAEFRNCIFRDIPNMAIYLNRDSGADRENRIIDVIVEDCQFINHNERFMNYRMFKNPGESTLEYDPTIEGTFEQSTNVWLGDGSCYYAQVRRNRFEECMDWIHCAGLNHCDIYENDILRTVDGEGVSLSAQNRHLKFWRNNATNTHMSVGGALVNVGPIWWINNHYGDALHLTVANRRPPDTAGDSKDGYRYGQVVKWTNSNAADFNVAQHHVYHCTIDWLSADPTFFITQQGQNWNADYTFHDSYQMNCAFRGNDYFYKTDGVPDNAPFHWDHNTFQYGSSQPSGDAFQWRWNGVNFTDLDAMRTNNPTLDPNSTMVSAGQDVYGIVLPGITGNTVLGVADTLIGSHTEVAGDVPVLFAQPNGNVYYQPATTEGYESPTGDEGDDE